MRRVWRMSVVLSILVAFGCASMGEKERTGTAAGAATGAVARQIWSRHVPYAALPPKRPVCAPVGYL